MEAHPSPPPIQPRRLVGAGELWVVEVIRTDDSGRIYVVAVIEFRDGKVWRDTRRFADPLEAPAWRAQWVGRIEESTHPYARAQAKEMAAPAPSRLVRPVTCGVGIGSALSWNASSRPALVWAATRLPRAGRREVADGRWLACPRW